MIFNFYLRAFAGFAQDTPANLAARQLTSASYTVHVPALTTASNGCYVTTVPVLGHTGTSPKSCASYSTVTKASIAFVVPKQLGFCITAVWSTLNMDGLPGVCYSTTTIATTGTVAALVTGGGDATAAEVGPKFTADSLESIASAPALAGITANTFGTVAVMSGLNLPAASPTTKPPLSTKRATSSQTSWPTGEISDIASGRISTQPNVSQAASMNRFLVLLSYLLFGSTISFLLF